MIKLSSNDDLKYYVNQIKKGEKLRLDEVDVSEIEDFSGVFEGFKFEYDYGKIENWDVSNGVNFEAMFMDSKNMYWFDFSKWNMSKAKNLQNMFTNCFEFEGIGLDKWNITITPDDEGKNDTPLDCTFANCYRLDVDFSNWRVHCNKLPLSTFFNCHSLVGKGLDKWIFNQTIRLDENGEYTILDTFFNTYKLKYYPQIRPI